MRHERLTIRLPGELASDIRRQAAEAGFPPATMARLLVERALVAGHGLELSQRLAALEQATKGHDDLLRSMAAAMQKILENK